MAIKKQFVKVIFPFQYNSKLDNDLEMLKAVNARGKEKNLFQRFGFENADLRKGLTDLFSSEENKSQIVKCYRIDNNSRIEFGLPKRQDTYMQFYCRGRNVKEPYKIAITNICIYLFETEVGFIEAECDICSSDIDEIITCNYFLTEIKSEDNYLIVSHKIGKDESIEERFTLKELLAKPLKYISGVKDFYDDIAWEESKRKGIIYTYALIDKKTVDFDNNFFNLRMNYKATYKAPINSMDMDKNRFVLQQFDNSYWGASYNGVVNISVETADEITDEFFRTTFYSKVHNEYYILFLAVLHQRYGLMKLMWEMGELDKIDTDYDNMKKQLELAREYQASAASMKFRNFFALPSYIQHVNDYYELIITAFDIRELYEDFTQDLNSIEGICKRYVEKINSREEQLKQCKTAKIEIFISVFGTLVGVVTFLKEAWELLEMAFGIPVGTFSWQVIVLTLVLWVPSIIVIINAINRIRDIREIKRKIENSK